MNLDELYIRVISLVNEFGGDHPVLYDADHSLVDVYFEPDSGEVRMAYQWPKEIV